MKVKLNFKNKGFKVRLNDAEVATVDVGAINSEFAFYDYTMDSETADALTWLLEAIKDVVDIIDSIPKVGFNLPSSGFNYKYSKLLNFKNQLISERDKVDANLTRYRNKTNTSVSYDIDRINAMEKYLKDNFETKEDFYDYTKISDFYKTFSRNVSRKDEINNRINEFIKRSNGWDGAKWLSVFSNVKEIKGLEDVDKIEMFTSAKRGDTFGEILLLNPYGHPVLGINIAKGTHRVIDAPKVDEASLEEFDIDFEPTSIEEPVVEEVVKETVEDPVDEEDEILEVSLDDAAHTKKNILIDTILNDYEQPEYTGTASKEVMDKMIILNDAKNLYEAFEEKTGKKVYGVGKSTGIRGEFYLLDENGNNIGVANATTREVRGIDDNPMENENIDKLLEDLKNDPYNSDFNGNAESGYVESEDGRVLGIYYESGKDSEHALSLAEVEMYFNPDMEVQKYIGLFESYDAYHGGQEPTVTKLISQNIYN